MLNVNFYLKTEIGDELLKQELTYPGIQPHLFDRVQSWLNLQSNPDELWDIDGTLVPFFYLDELFQKIDAM